MKNCILTCIFSILSIATFGQFVWDLNFDDNFYPERIVIDTAGNPNNIWQVGHPDKTNFNAAHSEPNVIVTDTSNSYPLNDTSSFMIIHQASLAWTHGYPKIDIGGWYYVNSDTLNDYGFVEYSTDKGLSWTLIDSTNSSCCSWGASQILPVFTGNSNGWKPFYFCLCSTPIVNLEDTILYRFTFISDSVETNKDGLMIDNLHFEDWTEGIEEHDNGLISVSPNPASDELFISPTTKCEDARVQIYNSSSKLVYDEPFIEEKHVELNGFENGIYILMFSGNNYVAVKKFVVQR